ncbi:MAG TPA: DUF4326 domain-containing protein [Novosphingobium sp.]|jgi:hypothetical protein|nr:DUF4326 domain-containing protein [Novosphingobium sp.]
MKPQRIQLSRRKGWRKPEGAVVVSRPSKWGNPYRVGDEGPSDALWRFEAWLNGTPEGRRLKMAARVELRGKVLCCWCALGQPCHADVLLHYANKDGP